MWPAAVAFAVGTVLYVGAALALRRGWRGALPAAGALFLATVVAASTPFRGAGSVAGIVLGLAGCASVGAAWRSRSSAPPAPHAPGSA